MFVVGDKVKAKCYILEIAKYQILTVTGVQLSWDGKYFLHFKEVTPLISYNAEDFEKVSLIKENNHE